MDVSILNYALHICVLNVYFAPLQHASNVGSNIYELPHFSCDVNIDLLIIANVDNKMKCNMMYVCM